jgi:hypothetical protein
VFPRPLTAREREVLDFLLSAEFPGVERLREQAGGARVASEPRDCCPSLKLVADVTRARPASVRDEPVVVGAGSKSKEWTLLLHVRDGWLDEMELVHYTDDVPAEFPSPDAFETPVPEEPHGL